MMDDYPDAWPALLAFLAACLGILLGAVAVDVNADTKDRYVDLLRDECEAQEDVVECTLTEAGFEPKP